MNMISTGAFLNEMDASNKQPSAAEKFAAVWEKKNAKAARAGGVSLMALSLAACGSSSSTTTTSTTDTTTTTTTTPTAVAGSFTVGSDDLDGGAGNDTFTATKSSVLNNSDDVDGGAGTDAIVMEDIGAGTLQLTSAGVENVTVSPQTASALLSLKNMSGVENVTIVNGDEGLDVTNLSDLGIKFTLDGVAGNKTFEVQATTAATEGAGSEMSFVVDGAGNSTNDATIMVSDATNGTATTAVETLNLEMTGTKSYVTFTATPATLKITGDGDAVVTVQSATKTIDASGATGNASIVTAAANSTVTGGAGDDVITITDSVLDVVDGGAGKDTVKLMNAGAISKTGTYTNIEVVEIGATNTTAASIDVDTDWAGITEFKISGTATASGEAVTIDDAPSGGILHVTSTDTDLAATYDLKTDSDNDSLTVYLGTATAAATVDDIVADDPETVSLIIGAKDGHDTNGVTILDATTLNVSGSGNADIGSVSMKTGGAVTVDASAAEGNLTFTMVNGAGAGETVNITTGSGNDTVTLEANSHDGGDSVDLGAGATDKIIMTGITSLGSVTDYKAETVDLTFGNPGAAVTTDLRTSVIGKLDIKAGTLGENLSLTGVSGDTKVRLINFDDTAAADTVSITYSAGTSAATVVLSQFGATDTANQGENLTIVGTSGVTLKSADAVTGDSETVFIETLNVNTLTSLTLDLAGAAAEITSGDAGGTIDIDSMTAAALTTLTMKSASDNTNGVNIAAATTDSSLTTIDASGMAGGGDVILGTGTSIIDRAGTAEITFGKGDDNLSFNAGTHGGNTIDMGTNTTTTASEDGDLLLVGGVISGNTTIDLSSTTDQITTLNGAANSAVQKGIDSVNLASATVASGTVTITGSSGVNHITGSAGADIISGGLGADQITGGAGANTITLTESTAAVDVVTWGKGVDTVVGMALSSDDYKFSVADIEAYFNVNLVMLDDAADVNMGGGDTTSIHDITATTTTNDLDSATNDAIIALTVGTYNSTGALETALEIGGSEELVLAADATSYDFVAGDAFLLLYNDGNSNAHFAVARFNSAHNNTANITSGKLTISDIAVFNGIDAGDIAATDLIGIA